MSYSRGKSDSESPDSPSKAGDGALSEDASCSVLEPFQVFVLQEYRSLRDEIRETKARMFRLAGFAVLAMPSGYFLAESIRQPFIKLTLPLLLAAILLLYISESRGLMRCGCYVKQVIEPVLFSNAPRKYEGWEHWLEKPGSKRRWVDKARTAFFYFVFILYYSASSVMAYEAASEELVFSPIWVGIITGVAVSIGVGLVALLILTWQHSTSTKAAGK